MLRQTIITCGLLFAFSANVYADSDCSAVQRYRKKAMHDFSNTPNRNNKALLSCLDRLSTKVREMQIDDSVAMAKTIKQISRERKAPLIQNAKDIQRLFAEGSAFRRSIAEIADGQARSQDSAYRYSLGLTLNGPIQQFVNAVAGMDHAAFLTGGRVPTNPMGPALKELLAAINPQDKYSLQRKLLKLASARQERISSTSDRSLLSPFIAKMILFESIRQDDQETGKRHFQDLVSALKLKAIINYKHFQGNSEISKEDLSFATTHQGYFIDGPLRWGDNLWEGRGDSTGMDCATMLQSCLEKLTGAWPSTDLGPELGGLQKIRLDTGALVQMITGGKDVPDSVRPFFADHFRWQPLNSESEIRPGDIIIKSGHLVIFSGYAYDAKSKSIEPVTYEARGDELRQAGKVYREVYLDNQCHQLGLGGDHVVPLYRIDTDLLPGKSFSSSYQPFPALPASSQDKQGDSIAR